MHIILACRDKKKKVQVNRTYLEEEEEQEEEEEEEQEEQEEQEVDFSLWMTI